MDKHSEQFPELELPQTDGTWAECLLGATNRKLEIRSRDQLRIISQHMADQAIQSLHILTRDLDPQLYDNSAFAQTVSSLARRSQYSFIYILIMDSTRAVQNGHRLVYLHQKLDSYIKIRKLNEQFKDYCPAFMLADERGVVYRPFGDRHEAEANYNDPLRTKNLLKFFEEAWEISEPDPQLRRLHI